MKKKVKIAVPPYPPARVSDWLYGVDPMTMKAEFRSDLVNACGFFIARSKKK